jgi:hypothetical protein
VNSSGGPLILADQKLAKQWKGIYGTSGQASDYDLACQVAIDARISPLDFGGSGVVVLGDEPSATTMFSMNSSELLVVRWLWGDSTDDVINVLSLAFEHNQWLVESFNLRIFSARAILFDSSCRGDEESLTMSINNGSYSIRTLDFEPNSRTHMILHRLTME